MRYGIFSDIHSNLEALLTVVGAYKEESIDQYLCCGDVVGYAANPCECAELVREICAITVAGNHDWAGVYLFKTERFSPLAKDAILWTQCNIDPKTKYFLESLKLTYKNKDLSLVHGTLDSPGEFNYLYDQDAAKETFKLLESKVCFIGHTHLAGIFISHPENHVSKGVDEWFSGGIPLHRNPENSETAAVKPWSFITDNSPALYCGQACRLHLEDKYKYIINVGSVGQPRDKNPEAAYCIFDTEKQEVEIKRIKYDCKAARKKIIQAGLPQLLGDRLLAGS